MSASVITLTNGVVDGELSALDRGLAYGDGLFETCRVTAGRVALWPWHRERLAHGAERLGIPLDTDRLADEYAQMMRRAGARDGVLKLIVTRGLGGRAYRPPERPAPSYCWQFRPMDPPPTRYTEQGVELYECQHRLGDNPALAGLKHLNRLEYVLARSEWQDQYPEGLLCDAADRVVEGTLSNIFVRLGEQWFTPSLERNGVAGVMRRLLCEQIGPRLGWTVSHAELPREQLLEAGECFVCNSVFGIWPVVGLSGGTRFGVGEQTRRWQRALAQWFEQRTE